MHSEKEINEAVKKLKKNDFIHSIILFGSKISGKPIRRDDIDLCIIFDSQKMPSNKELVKILGLLGEKFDLSFFHLLPINVRKKVLEEGKILFTRNKLYVFELIKETDFEYPKYKNFLEEFNKIRLNKVILKS